MIDLARLKTELTTDPRGYGYAGPIATGSDQSTADLINTVRDGTNPPANPTAAGGVASGLVTVRRSNIAATELLEAIDTRDFVTGVTTIQASWFESITQAPTIRLMNDDGTNTRVLTNLIRLLNNTNGTQTRLTAVATRPGSRAEELFGTDQTVSPDQVAHALRGL
jgi:hypothetical protein